MNGPNSGSSCGPIKLSDFTVGGLSWESAGLPATALTMNADVPLGVPALKTFYEELSKDPLIAASKTSVDAGMLMPNVPEMGRFWSAFGSALSNATNGQATPKEALDLAAQRMKPR